MCDVLFCFAGEPIENDPRAAYSNNWKVGMINAPCENPLWFILGLLPCTCCCAHMCLRKWSLGDRYPTEYKCCQGYFQPPCGPKPGDCGEKSCPELCMLLEFICCPGLAISGTRTYVMDRYNVIPDPTDNKIIRFNNFMQCLSCILGLLSICVPELRDAHEIIHMLAQIVFYLTSGCMASQMYVELFMDGPPGSGGSKPRGAPITDDEMAR